jgi:NAD(P)-dependent dehydrogenase (short-subunit alcohol dehydrogenase family)
VVLPAPEAASSAKAKGDDVPMSRVMITGSAQGLGLMAGQLLVGQGHQVTLHARNAHRAEDARRAIPGAEAVVVGDLSTMHGMHQTARAANELGRFDAVIHNAGVGYQDQSRRQTPDGLSRTFAVNVLAPYVLTMTMSRPGRLVYLSSQMQFHTDLDMDDLQWTRRRWDGGSSYGESKLCDVLLAFAFARLWPSVLSNAITPGWVATKMGGPEAPDDLSLGPVTQSWLAVSDDSAALASGRYFYHQHQREASPLASRQSLQEQLLAYCAKLSGIPEPEPEK